LGSSLSLCGLGSGVTFRIMQMSLQLLTLLALSSLAAADQVSPLQQVISMIVELEKKLLKEGDAEDKAFKEFFEWCDASAKEKQFELKTASAEKEKLDATISKCVSDAADASEQIETLGASISTDEADLKAATEIRAKELADFQAAEKELVETVDTLERAIGIIEKNMKGSALLQKQLASSSDMDTLLATLSTVIDAASLSSSDGEKLLALVQSQGEDSDLTVGAPAPAAYKNKSGGIVDVLNDMKEKAEEELAKARKAEMNVSQNFMMLKMSLEDSVKAANHEMAESKADLAEADETKSVAEGDLAGTVKDLGLAQANYNEISGSCMERATLHEDSQKGRAQELKALGTAKKAIQQSTFLQAGADSFLQLSSSSSLRAAISTRNFEVVNAVKQLAAQHHSAALAQLASRIDATIRYGAVSGADPFEKVKGLINEMIAKLVKEGEAAAGHKAYCDEEMGKTKAKKDELTADIEKLTSKIDEATSKSAELKEQVKELQKELADLADLQAEMDKVRADTHAAFVATKEELDKGIKGVGKALKVLRDYYESKEEGAFLQDDMTAFMQQPAAPAQHKKSSGAGGGIISMIEVILSDFSKSLEEVTTEEDEAQTEYDKISEENKITKVTKNKDVEYKTKEFQALDKSLTELSGDRDGAQTELDAVLEYDVKIKDECVAKPEPYEERKKRREAEIAGLKEALSILEGQAFLQRRSQVYRH